MILDAIKKNPLLYWDMFKYSPQVLAGCKIINSGIQSPWLNGVVGGTSTNPSEIVRYFQERNTPFSWWSECSEEPSDLRQNLESLGLHCEGPILGMGLELENIPTLATISDFQVERVDSDLKLQEFVTCLMQVYGAPSELYSATMNLFSHAGFTDEARFHFIGKYQGKSVSVGSLFVDSDAVASVYNMGTLESHRKMGFASALLLHALTQVKELGARYSALTATCDGKNVYQRLGYTPYNSFHLYM